MEVVVRRLLNVGARSLHIAEQNWWQLTEMIALVALACGLVVVFARVPLSQLGLYGRSRWSKTERFFFVEIISITVAAFCLFVWHDLSLLSTRSDLWRAAFLVFLTKMIWGFYQEFLYRGVLQTELVRRWRTPIGIFVSNLVFTFGPLHAYHFSQAARNPSHYWIFASIFSIGLWFAIIFHRSGNLWIVGILHGLGDWFVDGLDQLSRMTRAIPP